MNISQYGLKIIKVAGKQCNVSTTTKQRISGSTNQKDVASSKYSDLPCRYQQKNFSKINPISQKVEISDVTGIFYLPFNYGGADISLDPQKDIIVFEGKNFEILSIELPSSPIYVKAYVKVA